MTKQQKGYLLAFAGVVIFGLTLPFTRIAVAELPAVFVGLGRALVAAMLAGVMLTVTRSPRPQRADIFKLLLAGFGIVIGFPLFSAIAMESAPASHGAVVLGILPLGTAAAAIVFAGEKPSLKFWAWAMAGSIAVVIFALLNGGGGGDGSLYGADLWLLASIVAAAIGYAISGDLTRRLGGWQVISWCLLITAPVIAMPVAWSLPDVNLNASASAWFAFGYVAVFSQFLGFFFWNNGMAMAGVAKAGQVQLLQIFVTLVGSWFLLGEPITPTLGGFALVVAFCVWMGRKA
ncbi:MAG: DMT family transporter [Burkholderiaceae bacterium]